MEGEGTTTWRRRNGRHENAHACPPPGHFLDLGSAAVTMAKKEKTGMAENE